MFGLSLQSPTYQREARDRLDLSYELLSDTSLRFTEAMGLPTFEAERETYLKRLTLVTKDGVVEKSFYPRLPTPHTPEKSCSGSKTTK